MTVKPMPAKPLYQVLLLPAREVAARHQTLAEASAWVRTYNEALASPQVRAVIAEEPAERAVLPTRSQAA
ncbi:MAG: hypothetical protein ACR2FY_11205 [Pirellulaceae bacterium]